MPLFGPPDVSALKAKRDVQGLIKALGHGGDGTVRRAAAAALAEIGDPRAVEPLALMLKQSDWEGHDWHDTIAASDALVHLGAQSVTPLISLLNWHSKVVRVSVAGALATIGRPSVQPLIALMGDSDLENRETAGEILADIGADAVPDLIAALHDDNIQRRTRAARVLGLIGDARGVEPLMWALLDPIAGVRQSAAKSLGEIGDPRSADKLVGVLNDADTTVRHTVALALAEIRDPRAVPALLKELLAPKPEAALDAIVKIGVPGLPQTFANLADGMARGDEAWIVEEYRTDLKIVLKRLNCPDDVAAVVGSLFADDPVERRAAAQKLRRLWQAGVLESPAHEILEAAGAAIDRVLGDGVSSGAQPAA